jgi:hypothetical protein
MEAVCRTALADGEISIVERTRASRETQTHGREEQQQDRGCYFSTALPPIDRSLVKPLCCVHLHTGGRPTPSFCLPIVLMKILVKMHVFAV